jgi:hypothetical protein
MGCGYLARTHGMVMSTPCITSYGRGFPLGAPRRQQGSGSTLPVTCSLATRPRLSRRKNMGPTTGLGMHSLDSDSLSSTKPRVGPLAISLATLASAGRQ